MNLLLVQLRGMKNVQLVQHYAMMELARQIVDAAYCVHRALGPGMLEKVYEACLLHELNKRSIRCERQVVVPIKYDGLEFDEGFRIDILVEDRIVIELKAVEKHLSLWEAQLLSYLKMSKKTLGFLINFNSPRIKDGIKRMIL